MKNKFINLLERLINLIKKLSILRFINAFETKYLSEQQKVKNTPFSYAHTRWTLAHTLNVVQRFTLKHKHRTLTVLH